MREPLWTINRSIFVRRSRRVNGLMSLLFYRLNGDLCQPFRLFRRQTGGGPSLDKKLDCNRPANPYHDFRNHRLPHHYYGCSQDAGAVFKRQ
jgi:hypothetical protein